MRILTITISLLLSSTSFGCICSSKKFDSLEDLEQYKFIGLIKIDSIFLLPSDTIGSRISYQASFSIIELYRGDSISQIAVSGGNHNLNNRRLWTSCDMGLSPGEEWIIFAYETSDSNLKTGYCTFSKKYRSKTGQRDWFYNRGFDEIEKVKKLLAIGKIDTTLNGPFIERYPNGLIEVEASYASGLVNGKRTIRYQSGQIMSEDQFSNGVKEGLSLWYFEDGTEKRKYNYQNDHPIDSCWSSSQNGKKIRKSFYSKNGEMLFSSYYNDDTKMSIYKADTLSKEYTRTTYFSSGKTKSISKEKIDGNSSITTEFYESGQVQGKWQYFEDGDFKSEIKAWDENGILSSHQRKKWSGEEINLMKADNDH